MSAQTDTLREANRQGYPAHHMIQLLIEAIEGLDRRIATLEAQRTEDLTAEAEQKFGPVVLHGDV